LGVFVRGLDAYRKREYEEAYNLFYRISRIYPGFPAQLILLSQGFTLLGMNWEFESAYAFCHLRSSISFKGISKLIPPEWHTFESQKFWGLRYFYNQAKELFERGAFAEAMKRLVLTLNFYPGHILSLDLKFKILLECLSSKNDFLSLSNCGARLKAFVNERNVENQKLSVKEHAMVLKTVKRYLRMSSGLFG
jgi:tetratricopeptide (TPR) repeat protein